MNRRPSTLELWAATLCLVSSGCSKDNDARKPEPKPEVRAATFDMRVNNVIGLDEIVLTIDGRVVGKTSEPHAYIKVEVDRGVMLSKTPGHVKLHALSTCGMIDVPLSAPALKEEEEEGEGGDSSAGQGEHQGAAARSRRSTALSRPMCGGEDGQERPRQRQHRREQAHRVRRRCAGQPVLPLRKIRSSRPAAASRPSARSCRRKWSTRCPTPGSITFSNHLRAR